MKKRLITSALPYVNNIPHLGNIIQVLSGDVFARFCRSFGYETLYVCGTDEYGTATETRALEEKTTPRELCDHYNKIHNEIYEWFNISFDRFGRTSDPIQTEIVQDIFKKVDAAGYISEQEIEQLYSPDQDMFLADRYVRGTCPHCAYEEARGDQCENCGKLLEPTELINPYSPLGGQLEIRKTRHLYLNLPAVLPQFEKWMNKASKDGFWARNAIQMTQAWVRDGLKERAITRDLKWGIPVPRKGFENKVFYVWFDAPIGYISITAGLTENWKDWWQNPDNVELFQFIGKDNIPFHTVIFPSSLLATGDNWTMLHHMSSSEYLNYEGGKFSKSAGMGVFGNDCQDTGIPADVWRFYIFYNRPEKSDTLFTWNDFQDKVNSELIGNFANLINRTLTFSYKFMGDTVGEFNELPLLWDQVNPLLKKVVDHLERAELKDGLKTILQISDIGNKVFQEAEPWKTKESDPEGTKDLLCNLIYLIRDLSIMIAPYLPETSKKIADLFKQGDLDWSTVGSKTGIIRIGKPEILFKKLEDDFIEEMRNRFAGSQKDRQKNSSSTEDTSIENQFNHSVDLRVARITAVEQHPEADKLYIETLDTGDGEPLQIVSGIKDYYSPEELVGKNIILVKNLKPAKLRGVKSFGMLLAASSEEGDKKALEVLFANDDINPGTPVIIEGKDGGPAVKTKLKVDKFFEMPIKTQDGIVSVGETALTVNGETLKTKSVLNGEVG
ncbi:methionine--tRNA ligase [Spirochaeta cellobiosiphila]|uniref:methionine--tRNA ligase n=1 Tax=Spirochaeta cellobiosiphila TaxID=504483 RepID=UPI000415D8E6|nr:methionine--tRNA ligase [Spirochaeta cellobiosiphila]